MGGRHGDDLFVLARIIFHQQHAHRPHADHRARRDGAGIGDQHIHRIAVPRQGVRDKAVIARITHRRIEKAVHHQRTRRLVHLVFDGLAADGNLNNDVDVIGDILSDRNLVDAHAGILVIVKRAS